MKSVLVHLSSMGNVANQHIVMITDDNSCKVNIFKHKIEIEKGNVEDFVKMLFWYFFFSATAKEVRSNPMMGADMRINENLILNLRTYEVKFVRGKIPEWWDEFQTKLLKYKQLLVFM